MIVTSTSILLPTTVPSGSNVLVSSEMDDGEIYSKQPIFDFGLTQEWFRELYCGVNDKLKLHISSVLC